MPSNESVYSWLVYSAFVSLAVLTLGSGVAVLCRQTDAAVANHRAELGRLPYCPVAGHDPRLSSVGHRLATRPRHPSGRKFPRYPRPNKWSYRRFTKAIPCRCRFPVSIAAD